MDCCVRGFSARREKKSHSRDPELIFRKYVSNVSNVILDLESGDPDYDRRVGFILGDLDV